MVEDSEVPFAMPPVESGSEILNYFWEFGPAKKDGPLEPADLVALEHLLGIEWQPYQSRLLLRLSRSYVAESSNATKRNAPCPWPEFEKRWVWAQSQRGEKSWDAEERGAKRRAAKQEKK